MMMGTFIDEVTLLSTFFGWQMGLASFDYAFQNEFFAAKYPTFRGRRFFMLFLSWLVLNLEVFLRRFRNHLKIKLDFGTRYVQFEEVDPYLEPLRLLISLRGQPFFVYF